MKKFKVSIEFEYNNTDMPLDEEAIGFFVIEALRLSLQNETLGLSMNSLVSEDVISGSRWDAPARMRSLMIHNMVQCN